MDMPENVRLDPMALEKLLREPISFYTHLARTYAGAQPGEEVRPEVMTRAWTGWQQAEPSERPPREKLEDLLAAAFAAHCCMALDMVFVRPPEEDAMAPQRVGMQLPWGNGPVIWPFEAARDEMRTGGSPPDFARLFRELAAPFQPMDSQR